ncbi:hypothetical protein [Calidifontibacillus erzurumensis]|uniref:Uncharacterized protein n=1 Tax=Calidifontibacillus erzurumensis TaxID=2741433 RepID=A0A8J8GGG9_9BACI|nr:hypothetical protein [Calidifontibacillus erzurumensis]NSL52962.1 hypothetical protein [Calidifontibacillus erzurumensis]
MSELDKVVKEVIATAGDISSKMGNLVEIGLSYAPYIGNALNSFKFKRFSKRLKEHEGQIRKIGQLASQSLLSMEYISHKVFPIVLADLIEEHEDAKVNYILNGFQNVFIEEKSEESVVINYFDTLRNLRYAHIRRLFYFADLDSIYPEESVLLDNELNAFVKSLDEQLKNLGLIGFRLRFGEFEGKEFDRSKDDIVILTYGKMFIKFIMDDPELCSY